MFGMDGARLCMLPETALHHHLSIAILTRRYQLGFIQMGTPICVLLANRTDQPLFLFPLQLVLAWMGFERSHIDLDSISRSWIIWEIHFKNYVPNLILAQMESIIILLCVGHFRKRFLQRINPQCVE